MLLNTLNQFTRSKLSWILLFSSSFALVASALFFQHVLEHQPCVNCIYQRVAMMGISLAALIPLVVSQSFARFLGYVGWGVSSIWGLLIASEHKLLLDSPNPFFSPCPIVPNFPVPLYDWIPSIFGAPGDCLDQSWQFMSMSMPAWLQIIFSVYIAIWIVVITLKLTVRKHKKKR